MSSDHGSDSSVGPGFDVALRSHRLRAKLTQEELAVRAGVGVRTVRDLERGRASRPQRSTVELLAAALSLSGPDRADFLAAARRGHRATSTVFPAPPPAETAVGTPLPAATDLIGRDEDVADLSARLNAPLPAAARVITLVGLAGVGKSALTLVVAHRIAPAHPGGVAGVVVTEGSTAGEILGAIAAVFGAGRAEDLSARLDGRSAVIILDAVERAPDASAEAASWLLDHVATLRFLSAGRHPIGLPSERVWPLGPLPVPPDDPPPSLKDAVEYPAVALFVDRLARVRRAPVEDDEVLPLSRLVRRLGGLPLAIELAAARGRVLTLPEMLDRYGDRVLDLSGGPGDAVVSVRDAVSASYVLLRPAEQFAVRRLAMLRYRWSLAMAEQMIGPGVDVVPLLDRLLELGLLGVRGNRALRFRLVDVVRDFATERAAAEGDLTAGRRRHAEVMADLAQRIAPGLAGARFSDAATRLDDSAGDLGSALAFAAGEDPHIALRIAASLPRWWRLRGRDVTGRQWLHRLLDDPRTADADPAVRAWARVGLAQLALEHGAGAEEIESVTAALAEFTRLGVISGQLTAHNQLAALWVTMARHDEARRHGAAALELARRNGRIRDIAVAQNNLTWHEIRVGDLGAAGDRLAEVDRLAARAGESRLRAVAMANLAEVARLDGRLAEAERLGRRAAAALQGIGDPNHRRRVLATVGLALAEADRLDAAAAVLGELRPAADSGTPADGPAAVLDGTIARSRGDWARAVASFARAADAYRGRHDPRDVVVALVGLVASTVDASARQVAVRRLEEFCAATEISLLPREQAAVRGRRD
ncbi:ATP-binding protein [Mangrovihabitans endophyticus]|uniref:HTH cro/C1-type domain-containing protein n=1 Tax=Mangrovihabitans endophyticus TaxID=1751298 RepID=A0A8J3FNW5_9ACTN|nr:helix-turn-helix domain-containing protein [Mangrovihabitans endophyticus]GGK94638.1 hypothetical protein GCM10012284_30840 [Mangrovihabitans endophyticus]